MKKSGKLNNIQEVKEFWDEMLAPPTTTADDSPYKYGKTIYIYMNYHSLNMTVATTQVHV